MKVPRDVSGADLAALLCRNWQYRRVHQVGSHIILETNEPAPHRISVFDHHSLRIGTLAAIVRAVAHHKGVTRDVIIAGL